MLGRKMSREAWIVQQERRAKRIRVKRVTQKGADPRVILEVPKAKLQSEPKRETEESNFMIKTLSNSHTDMVFPRTTFPCHENSPLHVLPVTDSSKRFRNYPLSSFNGHFTGKSILGHAMKRARPVDNVYVKPEAKKRCLDSFFQGKEEISEADFQMALIKRSIARKKEWVYNQVLQNLELTTPSDNTNRVNVISDSQQGGTKNYQQNKIHTPFVNSFPHQSSFKGLVRVKDSKKVIDEEGNCYIDTDDYMSFNHHKAGTSSQGVDYSRDDTRHMGQETKDFDSCNASAVSKRGLFLNLRINGGVAIDHDSMPKIAAIYTHAIKGRREHDAALLRRHVQAKITGSFYRPTQSAETKIEETKEEKSQITKEEAKWWPPSPESMPTDVMSRDSGEGLLKVMTADDMKAYGIPKEEKNDEARPQEEEDDVVVTKIKMSPGNKHRNDDNKMEGMNQKTQDELPALQLDAYGKAANYKEILLHYISQKLKNDPRNTCLESISTVAERPRRNMSMEELCRKLKDTREKLEKEQLTWRRKLLSSMEVVLIKKIQRLEKESEGVVPDSITLEGAETMEKRQEDTKKEEKLGDSVKGSNSDIVAMMEDLTSENADVESTRGKKRTERNSRSVSNIRGYDSS